MKFYFDCNPKYYKNQDLYNAAIDVDYSDMIDPPIIQAYGSDGRFTMEVADEQILDLKHSLNDAIVIYGLDNQETVNNLGRRLYWIYDEILIQLRQINKQ